MSFPATTGILLPDDFEIVSKVYADIAGEAWFTRSIDRRQQFAVEIIDAYRQGLVDLDTLSAHCRTIARSHYGDGGLRG